MELYTYIILLMINSNLFIKLSSLSFFFIFILSIIFLIYKCILFRKYKSEMKNFCKEFNDKNIDLKEFYNKLLNKKNNLFGLSVIFFNGFKEFIFLHRKGIVDVNVVAKMVEKIMTVSMLNELSFLNKNVNIFVFLRFFCLYLGVLSSIFSTILVLHKIDVSIYVQSSLPMFLALFSETLLPLFIGIFITFFINIFFYKCSNFLNNTSKQYNIFINEFIVLIYHKLYN